MSQLRRPIIWIANEAGHSYESALELVPNGELRPLTRGSINTLYLDRMNFDLAKGIATLSDPEDFVIWCGRPGVNAMVTALWLLQHSQIKVLQWNAKMRHYELRTVTRENLESLLDHAMRNG
jgi:hypothetical protein